MQRQLGQSLHVGGHARSGQRVLRPKESCDKSDVVASRPAANNANNGGQKGICNTSDFAGAATAVIGPTHYVRVGALGWVGRFTSSEPVRYPRGCRVVCRTPRGVELGQVLSAADNQGDVQGVVLRRVTVEDDLLAARLERFRHEAFAACQAALRLRGVPAVLLDVEHLFDGRTIYFYFLGDVEACVSAQLAQELGELYAARVEFARFHEVLTHGCGPHCGTDEATGCAIACTTCAIAVACRKDKH